MAKTPWFNAQTQPPVNGGPDALYEHECTSRSASWHSIVMGRGATQERKAWIARMGAECPHCQWRGLTRPAEQEAR